MNEDRGRSPPDDPSNELPPARALAKLPAKPSALTPAFNSFSRWDRYKLNAASLLLAVTGMVRDDVEQKPWKFTFYGAYLSFIVGFGWGGTWLLAPVALAGYARADARLGLTRWGAWADARISREFTESARQRLLEHHRDCLIHNPATGKTHVSVLRLSSRALGQVWLDSTASAFYFLDSVKNTGRRLLGKPPVLPVLPAPEDAPKPLPPGGKSGGLPAPLAPSPP